MIVYNNLNEKNASLTGLKNSSSDHQRDEYYEVFKLTQTITGLYLLPFISLFGIIGSIFNIIVYKKSKRSSTNVYLIALSFSDIIKLLNDFLYCVVSLTMKIDQNLGDRLYDSVYFYSHYIFVLTAINTAWLTCAIAFDRYLVMVKCQGGGKNLLLQQKSRNYQRTIVQTLTIMILSVVFALPSPLLFDVNEDNRRKQFLKRCYNYFNAAIRAFIPLIVLVYFNFKITRVIYKNKMKKKFKKVQVKRGKKRSSITLMLFLIVFTFSICMFPDALMTMMQLGYANENYLVRSIREWTDLLLALNSSNTFPICYFFSIDYRQMFKSIFCSSFLCKKANLRN